MRQNLPFILVLSACTGQMGPLDKDESNDGIYSETGTVDETGDTGSEETGEIETGETAVIDTSHSGDPDTGETGDTGLPTLADLDVWPALMTVNVGATYTLRVVSTESDGSREDLATARFLSDDPAIADVGPDGVVTAVAPGSTRIAVEGGGLTEWVDVVVQEALTASVTVLDESTGAAIEGATVRTATGDFTTDATGLATIDVLDGGPITVTAWISETHHSVTLMSTVGRVFTIPLPVLADAEPTSELHGEVDFSGVKAAGFSELVVGVACASIPAPIALFELEDLLASDRSVSVFGVDATVPSNLFIQTYAEDYYAPASAGDVSTWGMSGPIAIADVTAGLNGAGDALELFVASLGNMSWGWNGPYTAVSGSTTEVSLAPTEPFGDVTDVALPTLPVGFDGSEEQFVLTMDDRGSEGYVVTGIGLGSGVTEIKRVASGSVPGSLGSMVYTFAQAGGVGSGRGTSIAVAEDTGGTVIFPDLQDLPVINSWDAGDRLLDMSVDPDAQLVRIRIIDEDGLTMEYITDRSYAGELDKSISGFQRGKATVQIESFQGVDGNLEHWFATHSWQPENLSPDRSAKTRQVKE